MFGGTNSVDK